MTDRKLNFPNLATVGEIVKETFKEILILVMRKGLFIINSDTYIYIQKNKTKKKTTKKTTKKNNKTKTKNKQKKQQLLSTVYPQ